MLAPNLRERMRKKKSILSLLLVPNLCERMKKKIYRYPIVVVGAQVGKPVGHSICLHVWNGGLRGRCLDGV
jgi:hypothetical protein